MTEKDNDPIVSVIIPTYNRADLLGRAIQSVLSQTYQYFEIIIVDDGSIDNTKSLVERFNNERIVYIQRRENSGNSVVPRNTAMKIAKGKYIAFLDSDDEWMPEKLEKQIKLFEKLNNSNIGFIGCNVVIVDEKNKKEWEYKIPRCKNIFKELLIMNNFIFNPSSVIVEKEVFNTIGLFDENLKTVQDYDMWIRIAQKYNFDFVPEPLFKYYIHNSNITNTLSFEKQEKDIRYIFEKYRKYYEANPKIHSTRLRNDGTKYVLAGRLQEGRKYFLKSIKINPLNFKSYFYFIFSLFGSKFYYRLTLIKKKLKQLLYCL
ncbi:MAG: glycosyltransferase [Candidatus Pacebacteria bacterium]|nr:glycosyltransferase [Candidatus Paceibacterota bacterium]